MMASVSAVTAAAAAGAGGDGVGLAAGFFEREHVQC